MATKSIQKDSTNGSKENLLAWSAVVGQLAVVGGQVIMIIAGLTGLVWGYYSDGVTRCFFGIIAMVLGAILAKLSSVTFNLVDGLIKANTRR